MVGMNFSVRGVEAAGLGAFDARANELGLDLHGSGDEWKLQKRLSIWKGG